MRLLAIATATLILGLSAFELTSQSSSWWAQLLVSFDYAAVRICTATVLLLLARNIASIRFHPFGRYVLSGLSGLAALMLSIVPSDRNLFPEHWLSLELMRLLTSIVLSYPFALLINEISKNWKDNEITPVSNAAPVGIGIVLATIVPLVYGQFLADYYETQLTDALQNQRLALARTITHSWSHLAPEAKWNGESVRSLDREIENEVARIRSTLERLSPEEAQSNPGIVASLYLQLDDFAGAVKTIRPHLEAAAPSPFAWDTYGLILQRQERWIESEQAYRKAYELWTAEVPDQQNDQGLASALRGIAYAQNRRGQVRRAEETYLELLRMDASAETHFLLAQFYEEEQQTEEAFHHATRAMTLAPSRFREAGQTLINQLQSTHMGCFQIYRRGL